MEAASSALLGAVPEGWVVESHETIDSTNERIKQALREGCAEGFCAWALRQEGGYGRQGRAWSSPAGGLYVSVALRPTAALCSWPTLSLASCLAVRRALAQCGARGRVSIKWPNDLLLDGGKIAGISLEAVGGGVCLGIGVNVFVPVDAPEIPGKYRPAYLRKERVECLPEAAQRNAIASLLACVLSEISAVYGVWNADGLAPLLAEYRTHMAYVGSPVELEFVDGSFMAQGTVLGIDDAGRLVVAGQDGALQALSSGEVHLRTAVL